MIPFNAWYFTEYNTKKDKEAIDQICTTKNKVRNRIETLLKSEDVISKEFKFHLAHLQKELVDRSILNYGKKVSFAEITLDDYFPSPQTHSADNIIYKGIPDKGTGYKMLIISKDGSKTHMDKTFNPYNLSVFLMENQYISLPNKRMKKIAIKIFESINPQKPVSLISSSKTKGEFILLESDLKLKFIKDTELIAKALINILYTLRCLLFHGELDPTETNQTLYKHAFYILKTIINELK